MSKLITVGQLLDETWDRYTKHFKTFMHIACWLFAVSAIWIFGAMLVPADDASFAASQGLLTPLEQVGMFITGFSSTLLYAIVTVWVFIVLVLTLNRMDKKMPVSLRELNRETGKKFFPYSLVIFLRSLIFLLPVLTIVPGFGLILLNVQLHGGTALGALSLLFTFLGIVAAIVLLIILGVFLAFPGYELLVGKKKIIESIHGSYTLVKGRFWATLWRLFIPKALITIATIFTEIILFTIFILLLSASPGLSDVLISRLSDVVGNLALTGITILVTPLFVLADYLVYESLKGSR